MPDDILTRISDFLDEVASEKAAEASASSEGHVQNQGDSGTSHPSKSTDDGTQEATEGARSAENSSDVKSDVPGQSVDSASEDKMTGASENPLTTAKMTGEDPANETASASGLIGGDAGKDSEGKDTSHPAKVDFDGKYASVRELLAKGQTKEAAATLHDRVNAFNARIAALTSPPEEKKATAAEAKSAGENKTAANAPSADELAGEKAAKVAAAKLGLPTNEQKQHELVTNIAKQAMDDADTYCDFLEGVRDGEKEAAENNRQVRSDAKELLQTVKRAMQDDMAGADMLAGGGEGEVPDAAGEGAGAGGDMMPPAEGEGDIIEQIIEALTAANIDPAELAEINPEDLAQALSGGGGGGGDVGMGAEGELPPEGGMTPEDVGQPAEMAPAAAL